MSRRTLATVAVAVLLLVLAVVAVALPVPYVAMSPGPTVDVLGNTGGTGKSSIIKVHGHRTYATAGQLRLTTVSVTNPTRQLRLPEVMAAWFDKRRAVYPRDVIYPPDKSAQDVEQQSSVEMVNSQDTAIAAALTELGYHLPIQVEVLAVTKGSPADGKLHTRDHILQVDNVKIHNINQSDPGRSSRRASATPSPSSYAATASRAASGRPPRRLRTTRPRRVSVCRSASATTSRSTCPWGSATTSAAPARA